jgi:hypothetical protein
MHKRKTGDAVDFRYAPAKQDGLPSDFTPLSEMKVYI